MSAQKHAVDALGELVAEFYIEADKWPDIRCNSIREQAQTLDAMRILAAQGRLSSDDAFGWLDMGRLTLVRLKAKRVTSVAAEPVIQIGTLCDHSWRDDGMQDDDAHYCTRRGEHTGPHACGWCEDLKR